jgi:hypothetical protein
LERELGQTKRLLQTRDAEFQRYTESLQQNQTYAETRAIRTSVVDQFAQGNEHFDLVADEVADILPAVMKRFPGKPQEALQYAYRMATGANPTIQQAERNAAIKKAEAERQAEAKKRADQAKSAAMLNAPGNAASNGPEDDEYSIQMAALQRARARKNASATMS